MHKKIVYHRIARQAVKELHHLVQTGGKYGDYALWRAAFDSIAFGEDGNTVTFVFKLERSGTSSAGLEEMRGKIGRAMPQDIGPYHRTGRSCQDDNQPPMAMLIRYAKKKSRQA